MSRRILNPCMTEPAWCGEHSAMSAMGVKKEVGKALAVCFLILCRLA